MRKPGLVILWVVSLLVQSSHATLADFMVDIGVADPVTFGSASPNDVQPGFFDFSVAHQSATPGIRDFNIVGVSPVSRAINGTVVTITAPQATGAVYEDNAPDVAHAFGDLIEDGIQAMGSDIEIRLTNLSAGSYDVMTWHHSALARATSDPFNILVNTGSGFQTVATGLQTSFGTSPSSVTTAMFNFQSSGVSDVLIVLDGSVSPVVSPYLNGFSVAAVPEPSTLLCFLGSLSAGLWLRRTSRPSSRGSNVCT